MDTLFDFRADRALNDLQIILGLEPEAEISRDADVLAQPQRGVGGNGTFAVDDRAELSAS
jgi:hypothetical protein